MSINAWIRRIWRPQFVKGIPKNAYNFVNTAILEWNMGFL